MKIAKWAVFSVMLAGVVALLVSSVGAQDRPGDRDRRVRLLDGRGAQIGVSVDEVAEGVRIAGVDAESPASEAGLRTGDVIVEVDGERVRSARQFARLIQESPVGRGVALGVMRDGSRQSMTVTPEARGFGVAIDGDRIEREVARAFHFAPPFDFDFDVWPRATGSRGRLGVQSSELTPELAEYFGARDGGVLVARVTADSPAAKAGIKVGDVILSIDGERVRSVRALADALQGKSGEVTIALVRDKRETSVRAALADERPRRGLRPPA